MTGPRLERPIQAAGRRTLLDVSRSLFSLPVRRLHHGRPAGGRTAAVMLAGGSGSRVGSALNKVYLDLAGRRVISWSLRWAGEVSDIGTFVVVVRPEDAELAERIMHREAGDLPLSLVIGGTTRHESEQAALDFLAEPILQGEIDLVAIHDGARPLAGPGLWQSVIDSARAVGGAIPALPAGDVLSVGADGHPIGTARMAARIGGLTRVQTPQAFRGSELLAAFEKARTHNFQGTDTASTAENHSSLAVRVVEGRRTNLKITYPHDLFLAERLLANHRYRLP